MRRIRVPSITERPASDRRRPTTARRSDLDRLHALHEAHWRSRLF